MANIRCSFRAGKIETKVKLSRRPGLIDLAKGNNWRGALLVAAVVGVCQGFQAPGLLLLAVAVLWSLIEMALRNWRTLYRRTEALALLQRDPERALALVDPLPGSHVWWQCIAFFFSSGAWEKAGEWLEQLQPSPRRDYLLAVALFSQGHSPQVLGLCPPQPKGDWLLLKAETHYQLGEWNKVLGMLRAPAGKDKLEHLWLKGASHYQLKQYKPAIRLLRQVVKAADAKYSDAPKFLALAEGQLSRR